MVKKVFKAAALSLMMLGVVSCGDASQKKPKRVIKSTYKPHKRTKAKEANVQADSKPVGEAATNAMTADSATKTNMSASQSKANEKKMADKKMTTEKKPVEKPEKLASKADRTKTKTSPKKKKRIKKKKYSEPAIVKDSFVAERNGIRLYEAQIGAEFPDASLSMHNFPAKAGSNKFSFYVKDYELQDQTNDFKSKSCANSGKGQHIHFIVNNEPYKAKYNNVFEEDLSEGSNVILAFLSRSYHESIKNESAYVLREVMTDGGRGDFNEKGNHLFYSRPKGKYSGRDAKRILLDFYLVNTELSENGYKVKATVNGEEFLITRWMPVFIEGLPMGKNTVRLQLVDANGKQVPGRFNDSGVRTFTLTK